MVETSLANVEAELVATMEETQRLPAGDVSFRVLLIGDWSGRANRRVLAPSRELKTSRPLLVDRDSLDQLIARLGVKLNIPLTNDGSQSLEITFNQLEDFHPDRLFESLEIFDPLRRRRAELENPATFPAAAAAERKWNEAPPATQLPESTVKEDTAASGPLGSDVLDRILTARTDSLSSNDQSPQSAEASAEISQLAKTVANPYLIADIDSEQNQVIDAVDARTSTLMNAILHHKDFQSLESAWRAVDFLVSRLETGTDLKLYLLDISFADFESDLRTHDDPRSTALYKLIVEDAVGTSEGAPWSVVAANYTFDFTAADDKVLESISLISQAAGAPFVAGVTSDLIGCKSLAATPDPDDWRLPLDATVEERWSRIRNLSSATYIGLALPRFLLRLPYGKATEPTEEFDFEEISENGDTPPAHESYLWANPAFAVVYLLAQGFSQDGLRFRPGDHLQIEGLPMHVYQRDGETKIKPCAEVLLALRAAEKIIARGLMPLLTMKDSDTTRLGMLQSITGRTLSGRWLVSRKDQQL
jgi:type VI secretion system protein ImpC